MLFDLRSPGRRRAVKTVYLFLALLIGGGLIFFGVGTGGNFGGLLSAAGNGGGGSGTGDITAEHALARAERAAKASPNSASAWASAGEDAYNVATLPSHYNSSVGFNAGGHAALNKLEVAWTNYLRLLPANPSLTFAQQVASAFSPPPTGVGGYTTAESAQEVVVQLQPNSYVQYEYLAYYAYYAKDIHNGDLATAKAIALAPKSQQKTVKSTLASIRSSQVGATGASGATGSTGATGATG
ncbi:MAG TPA: hypothetical protein VKS25_03940 [Solirubrobacteraceae bacterium]|nr:hypothetical protein [Solirubrobacteraceae bacterium]